MAVSMLNRRLLTLGLLAPALVGCGKTISKATGPVPDDMVLGNPRAKITVVEYASVACPVCGHWYKEVYPAFKAKYIDTGKIRFTYREMLVGSSGEVSAAAAGFLLARCAGNDKYFSIVDAIYNSQPGLFDDPKGVLTKIARNNGFTEAQFTACVENPAAVEALMKRVDANAKIDNINSTPTFIINGKSLEPGYHPLIDIDAAIAAAQRS